MTVKNVSLTIDDSQGGSANILTLTATTLCWFPATADLPLATLTFDSTLAALNIIGSGGAGDNSGDQFDVEGTPSSVSETIISNTAGGGPCRMRDGCFELLAGHRQLRARSWRSAA